MKKIMFATSLMIIAALLTYLSFSQVKAQPSPSVSIELVNCPTDDTPLALEVGESWTCEVLISSDEPFLLAVATTDTYYPGRSIVYWHGGDRATQASDTTLELTITGVSLTAGLPQVNGWPDPTDSWDGGVAPVSIRAGVRFKGGIVTARTFAFAVSVE